MKTIHSYKNKSCTAYSINRLIFRCVLLCTLILTGIQMPLKAQDTLYIRPSWRYGVSGGANFNFLRGSTQELNSDLTVPSAFHDGSGIGLFVAPLIEYYRPGSLFGVSLQVGYDSRKGSFDQIYTPCNCPADLLVNISYVTIEPILRYAPFRSNFHFFAGPRVAINMLKEFTYSQKINPDYPDQVANPDVEGNLSNVNKYLISMQVGAGLDIPLSSQYKRTQVYLSPFISFHPYFGQDPRSIETLNITTLRLGAALKFGRGQKKPAPVMVMAIVKDPIFDFTVHSPSNIPTERRMRETFPLRNYIYFNRESDEIPDRYVLLKKDQVKDFKEEQLEVFTPKELSGRSKRQMIAYYNILNILGDRMGRNPSSTIILVGSSEKGSQDGRLMAESVKQYLTSVFGIETSKISIEGRDKPKIPSEKPGGTRDLDLLREGDRRVSVESTSPAMLMEFQSGPDSPLRPVEIEEIQEAPIDSYVTFNVDGANNAFKSWSVEIKDVNNEVQYFGPYTRENVIIPGKSILGNKPEGDYKVTMIGLTKNGRTIRKETSMHMNLWTPPSDEEGMRFSIIFEFNDSKAIQLYEKYLTEVVTPKIPINGKVIIHGHTDIIGSEVNNQKLSSARANEAESIIERSLANAGRTDVKFEVYAFGENQELSPFENKFPEERAYNRTVIIDIIPGQ
jgi:outer membrane protein OmpA-like peptidoglycan-associated protein